MDDGDPSFVAPFQGPLDATLSYPLYFTLISVFAQQQSMNNIQSMMQAYASLFANVSLLGTFVDNHDNPRWVRVSSDLSW